MHIQTSTKTVPKLRFPEFSKVWDEGTLGTVFERITRKNRENNKNVLTVSAHQGLINQKKYFNNSVSAADVTGYYLIKNGEFAYNKSYSKGYPMGAIKKLNRYEKGVVSTLYICFGLKNSNHHSDYYEQYFDGGYINREINKIAQEGARNHGLLNMSVSDFFNDIKLKFPRKEEQQKIASFLSLVDEWIENSKKQVTNLEKYKKGMLQKLFSQKIRFKNDQNKNFPNWRERKFNEVLHEHKLKSTGKEEVCSVSVSKGLINQIEHLGRRFATKNTENYNLVKPYDIVYTKSPTGDFPLGIIKQSLIDRDVIVSPLYGVFEPETPSLGYILNVYFESPINTKNYLNPIVHKGAKNTINISNKTFLSKGLILSVSKKEQKKISEFLKSLDYLINLKQMRVKEAEKWKKGLMQRMFV